MIVNEENEHGKTDVAVIGGGTTGVCVALAAARNGARTALIESQGFLGGNACNGMAWYGFRTLDGEPVVGGLPLEIIGRLREMDGVSEFCMGVVAGSMVQVNTALLKLVCIKMCLESRVLLDCSDSGDAAVAAGAKWHIGRECDGKTQVASSTLFVSGVHMDALLAYFDEHQNAVNAGLLADGWFDILRVG